MSCCCCSYHIIDGPQICGQLPNVWHFDEAAMDIPQASCRLMILIRWKKVKCLDFHRNSRFTLILILWYCSLSLAIGAVI